MKGICRGEIRAKESKLADFWERGCTKCGRLDFILVKKMEIKSGFTFWNLVFLLMVSCVKGRVVFEWYIFLGVHLLSVRALQALALYQGVFQNIFISYFIFLPLVLCNGNI